MIPDLLYTWIHSPDGLNTGRALLRVGGDKMKELLEEKDETDAGINIEISPFGESATYVRIWRHKKDAPFFAGWKEED
jgi:hypothetical protein